MCDHLVGQSLCRAQGPDDECREESNEDARGQRPPGPRREAPLRANARGDGRLRQCPADIGFQSDHFALELTAGGTACQMFREPRRHGIRLSADSQACVAADHGSASPAASSGAGLNPYSARSLLRARNSRVRTAVSDRLSSCAISVVEKPPRTCMISGSRYCSGNFRIAPRSVCSSSSGPCPTARHSCSIPSSTQTNYRRLRSYNRACSRLTMVNSQARAAAGSFKASRDRQARNSVSWTTSSATDRSRASQWAKRSRSGRSDSNNRVTACLLSAARVARSWQETGVSGREL